MTKKEGREIDKESAELVALLGDGSFRDAFGMLEKILTGSDSKKITAEEVERIAGTPGKGIVDQFIAGLASRDTAAALAALSLASESGVEMSVFLKLVLTRLRTALLLKFSPDTAATFSRDLSAEEMKFLQGLSKDSDALLVALRELLPTERAVSRSFIPELPIELAVMALSEREGK